MVLEAPDPIRVLGVMRDIRRRHLFLPVVLVTDQDAADLQVLESVPVEAVIFQHQVVARLPFALRRSAGLAFALRALGEEYMRSEAIPVPLRRLLTCALTAVPTPRTVQHLAHLLNSDPATIRRHWRRGVNSHGVQRVKDLLDWLVLLHALSAKRPGRSWRFVATSIGIHERTLSRLALRLTGDTLGCVGSAGPERLLKRFADSLAESFCTELS